MQNEKIDEALIQAVKHGVTELVGTYLFIAAELARDHPEEMKEYFRGNNLSNIERLVFYAVKELGEVLEREQGTEKAFEVVRAVADRLNDKLKGQKQ